MGFLDSIYITLLSDSQSALNALKKPARQSGQWLLKQIVLAINDLKTNTGHTILLLWVPGHAKVAENERANLAAQAATEKGKSPERELPQLKSIAVQKIIYELSHRSHDKLTPTVGKFTQSLDHALPGKHTRKLYDRLTKSQAAILSQLRTGKNKLNYYLAKARIIESETCPCGREPESTSHFLLRGPRWTTERAKVLSAAGKHTGDLSFLLGGWDPRSDPNKEKWHPNPAAVGAAIQFVSDTGRFEEEALGGS